VQCRSYRGHGILEGCVRGLGCCPWRTGRTMCGGQVCRKPVPLRLGDSEQGRQAGTLVACKQSSFSSNTSSSSSEPIFCT